MVKLIYDIDRPSKTLFRFTIVFKGFITLLHFVDIFNDVNLMIYYYTKGDIAFFIWMVISLVLSSLIMTFISIKMYYDDLKNNLNSRCHTVTRIILCLLLSCIQIATVIRNIDCLRYARKALQARAQKNRAQEEEFTRKMKEEDSDSSLLGIFECYIESAIQLCLQLIFILTRYIYDFEGPDIFQSISIFLSFILMGFSMASYQKAIREDQDDKDKMSIFAFFFLIFRHIFFTSSRIAVITALALITPYWTIVSVFFHWFGMTLWISTTMDFNFCGDVLLSKVLFSGVIGIVYIFNFLNLEDRPTKNILTIFYTICFLESIIGLTIWCTKSNSKILAVQWLYYTLSIGPLLCLFVSLSFTFFYYKYLHPKKMQYGLTDLKNKILGTFSRT